MSVVTKKMSVASANTMARVSSPPAFDRLDLRAVLLLFRRHAGKIVLCVAIAVGCGWLYLDHVHPVYSSSAMLEVTPRTRPGAEPTEAETAETLRTVERKIGSQPVLLKVIRDHGLEHDADFMVARHSLLDSNSRAVRWVAAQVTDLIDWIRRHASAGKADANGGRGQSAVSDSDLVDRFKAKADIQVIRGSRLISVTIADRSPQRAQLLARAVVDEYFRQSRAERMADSAGAQELLQTEVARVGGELRVAKEKLEAYRASHNAVSLQDRQNIVVERLRDLNRQVAEAKTVRLAREADLNQVKRLSDANPEQLLGVRGIAELQEIIDLRKQLATREADLAMLAQRYGPVHPTMIQSKSALSELRSSFHAAILRATDRIVQLHASAKAMEDALDAALKQQEEAALELDRIAIPYNELQREVEALGATHKKLLEDINQAAVARGLASKNDLQGVDVRMIEKPLLPVEPTSPRRNLLLAVFMAAGLFTGCGLALGARALDETITSVDAAEARLGMPVLASIPRSRHNRLHRRPLALRYPGSIEAEAFRSLRTALSLWEEREVRSVIFTSAAPGEGKSFCAFNCATSFSQQGLRTLLIDADLRRPTLHRIFSERNGRASLTDCMRARNLLPEAVHRTPIEHLFQVGNWRHEAGSAELVARDGLREIIDVATQSFDRIVIDTAPLVAVSDTLYIAPHVSMLCLVVHAARTPVRVARRALKLLDEVSHRPATGLVLNRVPVGESPDVYYTYDYSPEK